MKRRWLGAGLSLLLSITVHAQPPSQTPPPPEGTLVVFPTDRAKWFDNSRFVKATRPDQQGECQVKGLPPGEYLAVAVDYVEDGLWYDPDYLDSLRQYAQTLILEASQTRTLSVKLVKSQQ